VGAGVGASVSGSSLGATVTPLTPLSSMFGGAGLDPAGLTITNGLKTATVDLSTAGTVEDMINAINNAGVNVHAMINDDGTGINLVNATQGTNLSITENGGTTATQLGLRSFSASSPLSELNFGQGVRSVTGADFRVVRADGTSFDVDITGTTSVQDVIDRINSADAGGGTTASFSTTSNGLVLTDTTGGAGTMAVTSQNFSTAAADLGLDTPAGGNSINGRDVNQVESIGLFATLAKLRQAMITSDQRGITSAATQLEADLTRVTKMRGDTGSRVQELDDRAERMKDQNVATESLLSETQDVDYTSAITKFQQLQTTLQATLQMTGQTANLSLLDFLR